LLPPPQLHNVDHRLSYAFGYDFGIATLQPIAAVEAKESKKGPSRYEKIEPPFRSTTRILYLRMNSNRFVVNANEFRWEGFNQYRCCRSIVVTSGLTPKTLNSTGHSHASAKKAVIL
jgi:hypothetical protein